MITRLWGWIYDLFYFEDKERQERFNQAIKKVKELEELVSSKDFDTQEKAYNLSEDLIVFIEDIRDGESNAH